MYPNVKNQQLRIRKGNPAMLSVEFRLFLPTVFKINMFSYLHKLPIGIFTQANTTKFKLHPYIHTNT